MGVNNWWCDFDAEFVRKTHDDWRAIRARGAALATWWPFITYLFQTYTLPSIERQTYKDFDKWVFIAPEDEARSACFRRVLPSDWHVSFDSGADFWPRYQQCDLLTVQNIDSDDMFHPLAIETLRCAKIDQPGALAYFEDGYYFDCVTEKLAEYNVKGRDVGPGIYTAETYTREAMQSREAFREYRASWRMINHWDAKSARLPIPLPGRCFVLIIHERNAVSRWDNPNVQKRVGAEITGEEKVRVLREFMPWY